MRKVLYIFFALYFTALAVTPCGDGDDCTDTKKSELCQQHEDHEEEESCTPLCVCSCCAAHFLTTDFQPSLNLSLTVHANYIIQPVPEISGAIIPIWQPPKLV